MKDSYQDFDRQPLSACAVVLFRLTLQPSRVISGSVMDSPQSSWALPSLATKKGFRDTEPVQCLKLVCLDSDPASQFKLGAIPENASKPFFLSSWHIFIADMQV